MLALEWLKNAHGIMEKLEATQLENIKKAAFKLSGHEKSSVYS